MELIPLGIFIAACFIGSILTGGFDFSPTSHYADGETVRSGDAKYAPTLPIISEDGEGVIS